MGGSEEERGGVLIRVSESEVMIFHVLLFVTASAFLLWALVRLTDRGAKRGVHEIRAAAYCMFVLIRQLSRLLLA